MVPPAPPAFSTSTCCFSVPVIDCAMSRATVSVGPPAANGTMTVIGLVGKSWAAATAASAASASPAPNFVVLRNMVKFLLKGPPW